MSVPRPKAMAGVAAPSANAGTAAAERAAAAAAAAAPTASASLPVEMNDEAPSLIYDKLKPEYVQVVTVHFMWDADAPYIATENCLVKDIDLRLENELRFGDLILTVNNEPACSDTDINTLIQKAALAAPQDAEFEYIFTLKRPIHCVNATKADKPTSEVRETETMKVLKSYVVMFPQSALGLKVKDISGKVIVSTVDQTFRSICKHIFNVGDYIVSINGKTVKGMKDFRTAFLYIKKAELDNFKVVFKRALTPHDIAAVARWLNASKSDGYSAPVMATDVAELCTKELARLAGTITVPPSIYVPPVHALPAKDKRLKIIDGEKKVDVGIEPEVVRQYLMHVPNSASGVLHQTMTLAPQPPPKPDITTGPVPAVAGAATAAAPPPGEPHRSLRTGVVEKSMRSVRSSRSKREPTSKRPMRSIRSKRERK